MKYSFDNEEEIDSDGGELVENKMTEDTPYKISDASDDDDSDFGAAAKKSQPPAK